MNKVTGFAAALLISIGLLSTQAAESKLVDGTLRGTLSDSMCKRDHAAMIKMGGMGKDAVSCTLRCLKEGNKLVFVDNKTKAVYSLQNPSAAKRFAGKFVTISGHIDKASKVIHVHSVR